MADYIHVEANSEVQQNSIYAGRGKGHTYLLHKREDFWHESTNLFKKSAVICEH